MAFGGTTTGKVSIETSIDTQPIKSAAEAFGNLNTEIKAGNAIYDVNTRRVMTNTQALDKLAGSALNVNDRFLQTASTVNKLEAEFGRYAASQEIVDEFSDKLVVRSTALKDVFGNISESIEPLADSYDRLAKATTPVQKAFELVQIGGPKISKFLGVTVKQLDGLQETLEEFGDSTKPITDLIELFEEKLKEGKLLLDLTVQVENLKDMMAGFGQAATNTAIVLREMGGAIAGIGAMGGGLVSSFTGFMDTTSKIQAGAGIIGGVAQKIGGSVGSLVGSLAGITGFGAEIFDQVTMWGSFATAIDMASRQLQGFNEGMTFMANQGYDTSMMALAMSLGVVGENLLFNVQATQQLEAVSIQAYGQLEQAVQFLRTISAGREIEDAGKRMQDFVDGPLNNVISSTEATYLMYNTLSAGIGETTDEAEKFTETVVKLAKGANADIGTVQEAMIFAGQAFGLAGEDADKLGAKIVTAIENGVINLDQMSAGLGRVSGTMAALGADADNTFAAIAAISQNLGADTNTALNSLANAILGMGEEARKTLAQYGASLDQTTIKNKGFIKALVDVYEAIGRNDQILKTIIPDSLGFSAALSLVKQNADVAEESLSKLAKVTGDEVETLFAEAEDTVFKRLEKIQNGFSEFITRIGAELIESPLIKQSVGALEGLLDHFQNLPPVVLNTIAVIANFNKVLSITISTLQGVALAALSAIGAIVSLQLAVKGLTVLGPAMAALGASFKVFFSLIGSARSFNDVLYITTESFKGVGTAVRESLGELFSWEEFWKKLATNIKNVAKELWELGKTDLRDINKVLGNFFSQANTGFTKLYNLIMKYVAPIAIIGSLVAVLSDLVDVGFGSRNALNKMADSLDLTGGAAGRAEAELAKLEGRVKDGGEEAKKYSSSVVNYLITPMEKVIGVFGKALNGIQKLFRLLDDEGDVLFDYDQATKTIFENAKDYWEDFFSKDLANRIGQLNDLIEEQTNQMQDYVSQLQQAPTLENALTLAVEMQNEAYRTQLELIDKIAKSEKLSPQEKQKRITEAKEKQDRIATNVKFLQDQISEGINYEDLIDPEKFNKVMKALTMASNDNVTELTNDINRWKQELKDIEGASGENVDTQRRILKENLKDAQETLKIIETGTAAQRDLISQTREMVIRRNVRMGKSTEVLTGELKEMRRAFMPVMEEINKEFQGAERDELEEHNERMLAIAQANEARMLDSTEKMERDKLALKRKYLGYSNLFAKEEIKKLEEENSKRLAASYRLYEQAAAAEEDRYKGVVSRIDKEKEKRKEQAEAIGGTVEVFEPLIEGYQKLQSSERGLSMSARAVNQEWVASAKAVTEAEANLGNVIKANVDAQTGKVDYSAIDTSKFSTTLQDFVVKTYAQALETGQTDEATDMILNYLAGSISDQIGEEGLLRGEALSPEQYSAILAQLGEKMTETLQDALNLEEQTKAFVSSLVDAGEMGAEEAVKATRKAQKAVLDEQIAQLDLWMKLTERAGKQNTLEYKAAEKELKMLFLQREQFGVETQKQMAEARLSVLEDQLTREKILQERELNEGRVTREEYERDLIRISSRFAKEQADERIAILEEELKTKTVGSEAYLRTEAELIKAQQDRIKLDFESFINELEQVLLERTRKITAKLSALKISNQDVQNQKTIVAGLGEALALQLELLDASSEANKIYTQFLQNNIEDTVYLAEIEEKSAKDRLKNQQEQSKILLEQAKLKRETIDLTYEENKNALEQQRLTTIQAKQQAELNVLKLKGNNASKLEIEAAENEVRLYDKQLAGLKVQNQLLDKQFGLSVRIADKAVEQAETQVRINRELEQYNKNAIAINKASAIAEQKNRETKGLLSLVQQQTALLEQAGGKLTKKERVNQYKMELAILKAQNALELAKLDLQQAQERILANINEKEAQRELLLAKQAAAMAPQDEAAQMRLELAQQGYELIQLQNKGLIDRQKIERATVAGSQRLAEQQMRLSDPNITARKRKRIQNEIKKDRRTFFQLLDESTMDMQASAKHMKDMAGAVQKQAGDENMRRINRHINATSQSIDRAAKLGMPKIEKVESQETGELQGTEDSQDLALTKLYDINDTQKVTGEKILALTSAVTAEHQKDREHLEQLLDMPAAPETSIMPEAEQIQKRQLEETQAQAEATRKAEEKAAELQEKAAKASDDLAQQRYKENQEDQKRRAAIAASLDNEIKMLEQIFSAAESAPTTPEGVRAQVEAQMRQQDAIYETQSKLSRDKINEIVAGQEKVQKQERAIREKEAQERRRQIDAISAQQAVEKPREESPVIIQPPTSTMTQPGMGAAQQSQLQAKATENKTQNNNLNFEIKINSAGENVQQDLVAGIDQAASLLNNVLKDAFLRTGGSSGAVA